MNRRHIAVPFALFALAVAVFANSLGHAFVWDDTEAILANPFLVSPGAWWRCFGRDFGLELLHVPVGYYRPLVFLSFIFNYAIGGLNPLVFHLTNVLLHGVNTVLVLALVARLADRRTGVLAAVLFAVHPIHAESVAFIAGRSDLLCAFFLLLAVPAIARSFDAPRGTQLAWSAASLLAYTAALLSKEMAIALPGVLIAYGLLERYRLRTLLRLCAPTLILAVIYLAFRLIFFPMAGFIRAEAPEGSVVGRMAQLVFLYCAQQVFPVVPTLGAEIVTRQPWVDITAVVLLALLIVAAKPRRRAAEAIVWTAGFLAPVLWVNLFTRVDINDRFAYVPSIGICALAAVAAARFWETQRLSRLVAAVVAVAFAALGFTYSRMWRDAVALWNASIAYHPQCGRCYFNLGSAYWKEGKPNEAVRMLGAAIKLLRDDERRSWAFANMAQVLDECGEEDAAVEMARRSLGLRPRQIVFRLWFASLLAEMGRHQDAIEDLETAQKFAPENKEVLLGLAREYLAIEPPRVEQAREAYRRAKELGAERDEEIEKRTMKYE